jgi:hypothetical protein
VIAVIAVIPKQPNAEQVFKSACMPAPPPLSEPAILNTRGYRNGSPRRLFSFDSLCGATYFSFFAFGRMFWRMFWFMHGFVKYPEKCFPEIDAVFT